MLKAFEETVVRQCGISKGQRVLVALSGGADSLALLDLFRRCADALEIDLMAAHLDHGLRPESEADAAFVAHLCTRLGIPLASERRDVAAVARVRRRSLEETARDLRREFLGRIATERGCSAVALGHQRDDQAETFLHRLLRGAGPGGLSAMKHRAGIYVRPLLGFSRRQLTDYLAERGLEWREDASNADPTFTRNRIRHRLLPLMRDFNPRLDEHLLRLSGRLALEEQFWAQQVEKAWAGLARCEKEEVALDRPALLDLHPALRARVIRRALEELRGDLRGIEAGHVEALERLVSSGPPQGELHLPGAWVGRRYERICIRHDAPPIPREWSLPVAGPGEYWLPGGALLTVSVDTLVRGPSPWRAEFAVDALSFPLVVRSFRPGDRMSLPGMAGTKKIKELFGEARVEKEMRLRLPVLEGGGELLWVAGLRRAPGRLPEPGGRVLRFDVAGLVDRTTSL